MIAVPPPLAVELGVGNTADTVFTFLVALGAMVALVVLATIVTVVIGRLVAEE